MLEPQIIYEDESFIAVEKPAGLLVHAAHTIKHETHTTKHKKRNREHATSDVPRSMFYVPESFTLVDWLLKRYPKIREVGDDPRVRPGIVHRLDKDTSGVMLVAKNQASFLYLKSLFARHEIQKTYRALVAGNVSPKTGVIDLPIGIRSGTLKRSVRSKKMAKIAITRYRVIRVYDHNHDHDDDHSHNNNDDNDKRNRNMFSLLEITPETGRTHQIRVHLASIGHPVVGDRLYGSKVVNQMFDTTYKLQPTNYNLPVRLMLHALSLEFMASPHGSRVRIEAEPPRDFENILRGLQRQ